MPHIPLQIQPAPIGPQRAPKSLAAVEAESRQVRAILADEGLLEPPMAISAPVSRPNIQDSEKRAGKNPFLKTISIRDWRINPKTIARKLTS